MSRARKTKQRVISSGSKRAAERLYTTQMQNETNKPIFVVGSPRSGTSILTWCLGQHPNIVALEESDWIGDLATNLAVHYRSGTARGDRAMLSAMDIQRDEFFATFGKNINELILRHRIDLERKQWECSAPNAPPDNFVPTPSASNPEARWVDGTPEYSFYICGLRKLFPEALFIHIVRDVGSVVRSMLNFPRLGEGSLVANEQEAYNYWFRAVSTCLLAERAYGPRVVFRLRYSDLTNTPEASLRSLLDFLSEPFAVECLTPLQQRINSSNVPADFKLGEAETDPAIVEQATRLSTEVEETPQPAKASPAAAEEMEAAFEKRVQRMATVDSKYYRAQQIIATLQTEHAEQQASYHAKLARLQTEHERHEQGIAELTDRLRKQLGDIRKLSRLLDDTENATARLRSSRRWKLANPGTAIKAKLFPGKVSLGYGHLEKIVAAYSQWRASHPEIAKVEDDRQTSKRT